MTDVNASASAVTPDALSKYRLQQTHKAASSSNLGKNQFMELMIAQMKNQDPLSPQDNGAFISQLAQFSSLEEMQKLTKTVDTFASQYKSSQALQASALVGRTVLVPAGNAPLGSDGKVSGVVDLISSTGALDVSVFNAAGELVKKMNMGQQFAGSVPFQWDGKNTNGDLMPFDQYTIKAEAKQGGGTKQLDTLISSNVNSVSIGKTGGISLNLTGMGAIPLANVREIN